MYGRFQGFVYTLLKAFVHVVAQGEFFLHPFHQAVYEVAGTTVLTIHCVYLYVTLSL